MRVLAEEGWRTWEIKREGSSVLSEKNAGKQWVMVLTSNLIEVLMIFRYPDHFDRCPHRRAESPAVALIEKIREAFRALSDGRQQSNARRYEREDAALSAFAVFFSQSPSFLDSQVRMQKQLGRNHASSLFGVHEIPCDNQIRNLLDPVPPEAVYPVLAEIVSGCVNPPILGDEVAKKANDDRGPEQAPCRLVHCGRTGIRTEGRPVR